MNTPVKRKFSYKGEVVVRYVEQVVRDHANDITGMNRYSIREILVLENTIKDAIEGLLDINTDKKNTASIVDDTIDFFIFMSNKIKGVQNAETNKRKK